MCKVLGLFYMQLHTHTHMKSKSRSQPHFFFYFPCTLNMCKHTCFSPSQLHVSHVYFLFLSLSSQLHISQTFHLYLPPVLYFFPSPFTSNSIFTQTLIYTIPHTLTFSHFSTIPTLYFPLLSTLTHSSSQPTMSGQPKTTGQACRMPQVR